MAIFQGEEMVPVTTPDGRTITVPRSLSGMAPQNAPTPMQIPGVAAPMAPAPIDESLLPAPVPQQALPEAIVEEGDPDVVPVTMMQPEVVTANPQRVQKARKQQAAQAASPQGQLSAADKQRANAAQAQVDAITSMADIDAATNDLTHAALVQRNADILKAENDRNVEMAARLQEQEKKMNEVIGLRKKIEGTKIDRTADHPILAGVFAALAGLGSAMKGEKVDTLDILYKAIDRKVAGQQADLDNMGKVYGMTQDEIAMLKEKSKNRLEFHNTMIAGEIGKAIRTVEEMTARSASERTRANGQATIAELKARQAAVTMEATHWGLEYNQRDKHQQAQLGLGYAGLKQADRHFDSTMQDRREERAKDMAIALANTKATGSVEEYKMQLEAAKDARQFGVRGMDAEFYLTPQGKQRKAEADKLEADAAAMESNPDVMARSIASDKIKMMRQSAARIRDELTTGVHAIKAHNETEAVAISNQLSSGQSVVQLLDEVKAIYDEVGRSGLSRDAQAMELKAKFNLLLPGLKDAWQLGAWDKGADGLASKIIGQDPSSEWNAGVIGAAMSKKMIEDPEGFKKGLDAVAKDLENKVKNKLVSVGTKFGKDEVVLQRAAAPDVVSDSATALSTARSGTELSKNAEQVGTAGRAARAVGYPFSPNHAEEAAGAQSVRYPGLSRDQEAPFEERLQAYTRRGDRVAGDELVRAVKEAAESGRPDQAIPLLHNLRDHAPKLYAAARSTLPRGSEADTQMKYEEDHQVAPAVTPPAILFQQVVGSIKADGTVGDLAGMGEITKLAANPGPHQQQAKQAIADIVKQSGLNKSLPRGSVFNKGAR